MSDKEFKKLLIVSSLTCIIVAFIWKYPEAVKVHATKDTKLGEYVYIDPRSIIHVNRKCSKLNYKGWKSERVKRDSLKKIFKETSNSKITFCPQCVNDKNYELINNNLNK